MKPKIKLLFTVFLCSISSVLFAQSVNIKTAKTIAEHHLVSISQSALKSTSSKGKNFQFTSVKATVENKDTLYYILNDTINKGFVIVSADMRVWPILGYSKEGSFNENKQPEGFTAWMDSRKKEIEYIKKNDIQPDSATVASWQNLSLKNASTNSTSVEPLLKTKWDQGCYYNELCPSDIKSSYCGHAPTGCVATAMAQIMKYWNYPTKGKGSHSYLSANYGVLKADFGATTYQWSQMPNSVTSQNDAVATLMYHCGVAAFMEYGANSSEAGLPTETLVDFFDYSSSAELIQRDFYDTNEWIDQLKSELDLGHPIFYTKSDPFFGAHAYVCDGYQAEDYFHLNWGWGGSNDGYFLIKSPSNGDTSNTFCENAIIKIMPNQLPDGYNGLILSSKTFFLKAQESISKPYSVPFISSSNWTATSDQAWLRIGTCNGVTGNSSLTISATENLTNLDRTATITLTAVGSPSQLITVNQFHKSEIAAGRLHNLLEKDLLTVTDLTLKGVIDARDFKTMRDEMPRLKSVDLSEATITAYSGHEGTSINAEHTIYPANTIPEFAFTNKIYRGCKNLTSITLPVGVTSIGKNAFSGCMRIANVALSSSLQSIDEYAFDHCISLKSIFIPAFVITIERQLFCKTFINVHVDNPNYSSLDGVLYNKSKTLLIHCPMAKVGSFNIPATVTSIGFFAFYECSHFTSITIPPSVAEIQEAAFSNCVSLSSIHVGTSVPVDLKSTFGIFDEVKKDECTLYVPYQTAALYRLAYQWKDFKNIVEAPSGFNVSSSEIKLASDANSTATVSIKSNVAWTATSDQSWLSVSPASGIGDNTLILTAQKKTTEGTRSALVTVAADGFEKQFITVVQEGAAITVTAGKLASLLTKEELETITSLKLTGTINAIDFKTMRDRMPRLASIDLSGVIITAYNGSEGTSMDGTTNYPANAIPKYAFYRGLSDGKNSLKSFVFPASTTLIDELAFCFCKGLTSVSQLSMLQNIGVGSFRSCNNLTNIFIPSTVTSIFVSAFLDCNAMIFVDPGNPNYSSMNGVLYNKNQTSLIRCPTSKTGSFIIPATVTEVDISAFSNCSEITSITIPSSIKKILNSAFALCNGLSSIILETHIPVDLSSVPDIFVNVNKDAVTLYVPYGTVVLYREAAQWKDFKNIIELPNQAPIANAGLDQIIKEGKQGTLNATGSSDAEGNYLTYKWTAPSGITLNSTTVSKPTFTAPDVVTNTNFTFSLVVNDGVLDSSADQVVVTVTPNKVPTANAGIDQTVKENSLCTLDGSASSDPDKDALTYLWTAPAGITLSSNTASKPTFNAMEVTNDTKYTFSLVVNDGLLNSTNDQVIVTVKNVDKAPYVKNPIKDISVDKRATDQTIDLQSVFADDDLGDVLSYNASSNTNSQVVTAKIADSYLSLSFSSQYTGSSDIVITANSNGKEVSSKFNVEIKIPTGNNPFVNNQNLILYPNPTNGKIKIVFDRIPQNGIELMVTDVKGKAILKQIIQEKEVWIDLSGNVPGIYFMKTDQKNFKAQIVILK